ncbi:hypothetical protein J0X14_04530 [Muricauda sp. CAU 1633]|uniref:DUF6804 family protein n=1 Tax=Allomuricauda sp. CAU 1633 TaxID=2816036 RepID=UPI001A8EDDBB|nr:DUF6804 family protein [Muricauda sp. CAU 1633]MBO0321555.1 hypothetical protein [Muricauda sp. CAU 1633]
MSKGFFDYFVSVISACCALLLFIAVLKASREYYWLLRTVIFIGALLVIIKNSNHLYWGLLFGLVAILFNPIFPIFLYKKMYWVPLDILTGMLFLIEVIINRPKKVKPVPTTKKKVKKYERDRMY